jgi:hypothetical protein
MAGVDADVVDVGGWIRSDRHLVELVGGRIPTVGALHEFLALLDCFEQVLVAVLGGG